MKVEHRAQVGLKKSRGHALVDDDVALVVDHQPVVKLGAAAADLDVLQRIGRVGAGAPHATVFARVHVGHIGPDHWKAARAKLGRQRVHVLELARVGLVRGGELTDAGVGFLQVDVDQRGLAAKAEALARGVGFERLVELAAGQVGLLHGRVLSVGLKAAKASKSQPAGPGQEVENDDASGILSCQ